MILVHDVTVSASCPLPGTVDYCVDHVWPGVWTMCVNVNVNVNVTRYRFLPTIKVNKIAIEVY